MPWMLALLTTLLVSGFDNFRQIQVRIEGYLGATQQETKAWKELQVRIGEGPLEKFAMTNVIVLSDGPTGADIVEQVLPIKPNFIFAGGDDVLAEISSAETNQLLKITGYTQYGSRWVLVQTVEKSAPIVGPTATPSLREKLLGF